jgi:hypothetical protein
MSEASARRKVNDQPALLDTELEHLPAELRWSEWMGRVEAAIFCRQRTGDTQSSWWEEIAIST